MIHHLFCLATVLIKLTYSNNMLFIIRGNYVKIVFVHGSCTPTSDFVSSFTGQRLWREAAILIVEHILFPWDIVILYANIMLHQAISTQQQELCFNAKNTYLLLSQCSFVRIKPKRYIIRHTVVIQPFIVLMSTTI